MSFKIRRGTDAERLAITPDSGELVFVTDTGFVYIGDGSTAGGLAVSTAANGDSITVPARKGSAGTITAGTPVYISGWNVGAAVVEVEEADSSAAATMPAIGIANTTITSAATGDVISSGKVSSIDTSTWTENDALYVSETTGTLTDTRPTTAAALIQSVARVVYVNVINGVIQVIGAGRSNDVPNLTTNTLWMGNGSNVATETAVAGIDSTAIHDNVAGEISAITAKGTIAYDDLVIIEDSAAANVKKSVKVEDILDLMPYLAFDNTGGQNLPSNASAARVNLDTENIAHGNYALSGDRITVTRGGIYLITTKVSVDFTGDYTTLRGTFWAQVQVNGAAVAQAKHWTYWREVTDITSVGGSTPVRLAASDIVDMYFASAAAITATHPTVAKASSLGLYWLSD